MKYGKALSIVAVLALAVVCLAPIVDDNDAASNSTLKDVYIKDNDITLSKDGEGSVTISYIATSTFNGTITIKDGSKEVYSENVKFYADTEKQEYTVNFVYGDGKSGTSLSLILDGTDYNKSMIFNITYNSTIWDHGSTYLVIIVVIILIIALVVYKSRNAPKKEKNTLTFEQVEAEKQASRNNTAPTKESKTPAVKSERQRYLASKKK